MGTKLQLRTFWLSAAKNVLLKSFEIHATSQCQVLLLIRCAYFWQFWEKLRKEIAWVIFEKGLFPIFIEVFQMIHPRFLCKKFLFFPMGLSDVIAVDETGGMLVLFRHILLQTFNMVWVCWDAFLFVLCNLLSYWIILLSLYLLPPLSRLVQRVIVANWRQVVLVYSWLFLEMLADIDSLVFFQKFVFVWRKKRPFGWGFCSSLYYLLCFCFKFAFDGVDIDFVVPAWKALVYVKH